jgi:hypothetical protein
MKSAAWRRTRRGSPRSAPSGVEQVKERARDERRRGWPSLEQLVQDCRFAARGLRKSRGCTVVAVLTLALGIGVNTAMFTAVQAILLRDLPPAEAGRVVRIFRTSPHSQRWPHSPANFLEQQSGNDEFAAMAAVDGDAFNLAEPGQPAERVTGRRLSAEILGPGTADRCSRLCACRLTVVFT